MEGLKLVFGSLACVLLASALAVDVVGDNYIVGGRNANRHQFPWIVSLRNTMNRHHCGGFILSDRWVGSAAHCTIRRLANPNNLIIASGAHTQTDGRKHRVDRIVNHPRYNQEHVTFDFSIIQTVDRIPITPQGPVRAIRFPTGPVVHDGSTVFIAGWGWSRVRHITRTLFFWNTQYFLHFCWSHRLQRVSDIIRMYCNGKQHAPFHALNAYRKLVHVALIWFTPKRSVLWIQLAKVWLLLRAISLYVDWAVINHVSVYCRCLPTRLW